MLTVQLLNQHIDNAAAAQAISYQWSPAEPSDLIGF